MKWWVLIGAAALVATAPPASAQLRAQVVPAKFSAVLPPGRLVSRDVSVTNLSGEPAVVRVHLSDFTVSDQGQLDLAPRGSTQESIDSLVQFEPREFSLGPGETRRIHVTARIAPDGPATRWGVLLSEVRPAVPRPAGFGPRATAELGTTIYLSRAGSTVGRPVITGMDILPAGRDSVTVSLRLRNIGDRHFYVSGEAGIADDRGAAVASGSVPIGVVLPGRVRRLSWTGPAKLVPGVYRASMSLDTGEPELLVGEASFRWPLPGAVETVISR